MLFAPTRCVQRRAELSLGAGIGKKRSRRRLTHIHAGELANAGRAPLLPEFPLVGMLRRGVERTLRPGVGGARDRSLRLATAQSQGEREWKHGRFPAGMVSEFISSAP